MSRRSAYGLTLDRDEDWRPHGLCRDNPDLWCSPVQKEIERAVHICGHCPVKAQCRAEGERAPNHLRRGVVYGGTYYADGGQPDRRRVMQPTICGWCVRGH